MFFGEALFLMWCFSKLLALGRNNLPIKYVNLLYKHHNLFNRYFHMNPVSISNVKGIARCDKHKQNHHLHFTVLIQSLFVMYF